MAKVNQSKSEKASKPKKTALTPEGRENQLASLAFDLAEQQLRDGSASSQVITHFLKCVTTKAQLEKEKLRHETEMIRAKRESIEAEKRSDEMYEKALKAMRTYNGQGDDYDYEDEYYD
jgi:hypothetical protein